MAKLIPDNVEWTDPRRNGEKIVYEMFEDKNIHGTAYYSLFQKNHKHKMIGEVDFLYICKKGILCLEVKGGQRIRREDMTWYSTNKIGVENEIKDPFKQARDCMYALKNYLKSIYGKKSKEANYLIGYGVIFPECVFTGKGNDLVTEVVYDGKYEGSFLNYLDGTLEYWASEEFIKHGDRHDINSDPDLRRLNDLIRGDFCVVPSMSVQIEYAEKTMLKLTEEQYDVLIDTEENDRNIIRGVAGTGKTVLALELARSEMAKKRNVLYLCYNNYMSQYVRMNLNLNSDSYAGTIHSFIRDYIESGADTPSAEEICTQFLDSVQKNGYSGPVYDYMIVDEAQDLMNGQVWEALNIVIKGGMSKGKWTIFLDPNQNIFNNSELYDFAYDYMKEAWHPFVRSLTRNCRNTAQISRRTSVLTSVPPARHMKVSGPNVSTHRYRNETDACRKLASEITSYIGSGGGLRDIAILSKYKLENSCLKTIGRVCGCQVIENPSLKDDRSNIVRFYTIASYKGLESKVVFYINEDGFLGDENRMANYIAMSRARAMLYLFYPESKRADYEEAYLEGQELLE